MGRNPVERDFISNRVLIVDHRLRVPGRHIKEKDVPHSTRWIIGTVEIRQAYVKRAEEVSTTRNMNALCFVRLFWWNYRMTKDQLKQRDQDTIKFAVGDKSGTGTVNHIIGDDRFQIIYFKPQSTGGASDIIDLTDEMIEAISETADKLVLEA
jgi:hypothetical protein